MISIDGIKIPKVVSIECNHDTNFMVFIDFYVDDRLDGCMDPEILNDYSPVHMIESTNEDIGEYRVMVRAEKNEITT